MGQKLHFIAINPEQITLRFASMTPRFAKTCDRRNRRLKIAQRFSMKKNMKFLVKTNIYFFILQSRIHSSFYLQH